jgi:RNA polymerase sigma-70 factor (ECF subfamily)
MTTPSSRPHADVPHGETATSIQVRRAIENDRASVAWLVSRFTPLLLCQVQYRIAPSLRRVVDPDDVVADVWVVVLGTLPDLAPSEGSFSRGLLRFASTVLVRRLRDLLEKHVLNKPAAAIGRDADVDALAAETRGVVSHVVAEERKGLVWASLNTLPDQDRELVVLRGIEGRSYKEIAARIGLTPENASARYYRTLKRLREAIPMAVFDDLEEPSGAP